ncbi:hypothetical protein [Sinomonas sp. ASV322]|uniref:hypothetical protein n=1 Tax=Sinomonas sp. ASV322 TaxID=3041920 RepID=UPI0027DAD536|nr:hypothetical protein [Sinomonas sp. ASV322]MDQ4501397.1 hypothetical protein [Sinomonas sp. ASV322]
MKPASKLGASGVTLVLALVPLTACHPHGVLCEGALPLHGVKVTITRDRLMNLASNSIAYKACQDGKCTDGLLFPRPAGNAPSSSQPVPWPTRLSEVTMPIWLPNITESPVDLTLSGKTPSGEAVGPLQVTLKPKVYHPYGPQCQERDLGGCRLGRFWPPRGMRVLSVPWPF